VIRPTVIPALRDLLRSGPSAHDAAHLNWATGVPLRLGTTHEWFNEAEDHRTWNAPIAVLAALAACAVHDRVLRRVVWIGDRVFPFPAFLDRRVLVASVFIDPPSPDARLWAIDMALRSQTPTCVVADGQGLTLAASRRLRLAAGSGRGLGLLARPGAEHRLLSAATTRWRVEPHRTERPGCVAWSVTLLRNKDLPLLAAEPRSWILESDDAQGLVVVPPLVAGGTDRAAVRAVAS